MSPMRWDALAGVVAVVLLAATGVVAANAVPMAEAGLDQNARVNEKVYLDAGGSWDPDGNVTGYEWRIERPNGTFMTTACATCPRTRVVPRQIGRYNVTVRARDEAGATATDTLYLDVSTAPPSNSVLGPSTGSGSSGKGGGGRAPVQGSSGGSGDGPAPVLGGSGGGGGGGGSSLSLDPSRIMRTTSGEYVLRTPDGLEKGEFDMRVGGETVQIPEWQMNQYSQDDAEVNFAETERKFHNDGANKNDIRHELQNYHRSCGSNVCTAMVSETTGAPTTEEPTESDIEQGVRTGIRKSVPNEVAESIDSKTVRKEQTRS